MCLVRFWNSLRIQSPILRLGTVCYLIIQVTYSPQPEYANIKHWTTACEAANRMMWYLLLCASLHCTCQFSDLCWSFSIFPSSLYQGYCMSPFSRHVHFWPKNFHLGGFLKFVYVSQLSGYLLLLKFLHTLLVPECKKKKKILLFICNYNIL